MMKTKKDKRLKEGSSESSFNSTWTFFSAETQPTAAIKYFSPMETSLSTGRTSTSPCPVAASERRLK